MEFPKQGLLLFMDDLYLAQVRRRHVIIEQAVIVFVFCRNIDEV